MNYTFFTNAFDLFASCYVYGCLTYVAVLFILHVYCSLSASDNTENQTEQVIEPDFYSQVKDLLNPATEEILTTDFLSSEPLFEMMTLRELRAHIKDNQLHDVIRDRLGKTVSNACKPELIATLKNLALV